MYRGILAGASETQATVGRARSSVESSNARVSSVETSSSHVTGAETSSVERASVEALLESLLAMDREGAALHARSTRVLAELARRSVEMGARHAVPDPRAEGRVRGRSTAGDTAAETAAEIAREATLREQLGARLVVAELAVARRLSEATVRVQLDDATRLVRLPSVLDALDDGLLTPAHARALADGASEVPARAVAEFETLALPTALAGTPAQVRRRARALRERLHRMSIDIRAARRRRERRLVFEADHDGMAWLHLHLPCSDARGAFERIDGAARSLASAPGEARTIGQIRADVAGELLLFGDVEQSDEQSGVRHGGGAGGTSDGTSHGTSHSTSDGTSGGRSDSASHDRPRRPITGRALRGRGRYAHFRPTVRVTVPVLSLLGQSEEPAVLDGYGPIPLGVAEEIAASAPSLTRILTHPETGAVLSVGRRSYAVPADLKRFVQLRDVRCRFPGCERGAESCDIDHTRPWEHGGETSHENLACLCRAHHRLKHQTAWQVSRPPGTLTDLRWTSPFGRVLVDSPDPPF